jgi:N-acetylmuramoyl-L-alanine amidase
VHANSFSGSAIRGAIIYTASEEATDRAAAALAEAENQSDVLAGIDIDGEDANEVKDILVDLTRRETRNFGVVFAQNLVRELGKTTNMFKIPHQQASFKVLEAPDVPSALIELGYLTNPSDEKLLVSPEWQAETAASVVDAIDAYFGNVRAAEVVQP